MNYILSIIALSSLLCGSYAEECTFHAECGSDEICSPDGYCTKIDTKCNINETEVEALNTAVASNCNCQNVSEPICQLYIVNGMRCKENATSLCRSSISDLAASVPIECEDVDPRYKIVHDLLDSCAKECLDKWEASKCE